MKTKLLFAATAALALLGQLALPARTLSVKTIEDGGTGPYKAVMTVEEALPGFAVYRPADMAAAVKAEGRALPIVLFGNGGCAVSSRGSYSFLEEIASHGYVVAAIERENAQGGGSMFDPEVVARQKADGLSLVEVVDWLEKENARAGSDFYQMVDPMCVSAAGYSCGGLQALAIGVGGDERVKCLTILSSGITNPGDGLAGFLLKEDLAKIKVPIGYFIGGESDIAYLNGLDDYRRITHVPVVFANYDAGHGETFGKPHGGTFAQMALTWLDYNLKGKEENGKIFRYCEPGDAFGGWRIESKNFNYASRVFTLDLDGREAPLINAGDQVTYNAAGGVQGISGTTDPTIKVFLPEPAYNSGAAVIILSGGGLMFHSWGNDVESMASWLNRRGVAVIGLKYHLGGMRRPQGGAPAARPAAPAKPLVLPDITGFDQLTNANCNPDQSGATNPTLEAAAEDALKTIRLVRAHAEEWGIDPQKVGYLGYSAGGGVAISATLKADAAAMPNFLASCYGPSLENVVVPENAPKLFIAVRAQHNNVASGMLALYLAWKKAGVNAEMYIYDDGNGPFGPDDLGTTSGAWRDNLFRWMQSNGIATGRKVGGSPFARRPQR